MKAISFFALVLFTKICFAQMYVPLPFGNARWLETKYSTFGPSFDKSYSVFSVDTLSYSAFGHNYKKYEVVDDSVYTFSAVSDSFFLYDDTTTRQVFMLLNNVEYLVYDFSKSVGDTIFNIYPIPYVSPMNSSFLIVDSIQTEMLYGTAHKVFYLSNGTPFHASKWIEGIGSTEGLFNNIAHAMPIDPIWGLNCVHQNNNQLYGNSCNFKTVGLNDNDFSAIHLVANPIVSNMIEIANPSKKELHWSLLSYDGKMLKKGNELPIPIPEFSSGIYLLKVYNDQISETFKIDKR